MHSQASEKKVCVLKNQLYAETVWAKPTKIFLMVSSLYPNNSVRLNYCLAASEYFSEIEGFDFDIELKLRPYCCIIGIDNSSVDKYLKISKVILLHAIWHDAGGFIYEIFNQGPGYSYMLPWKSSNWFSGHLSGILFCLYIEVFHPSLFQLLKCRAAKQLY